MRKLILLALSVLALSCSPREQERWSAEKANEWYSQQEWPVGCNYVPSYAINQLEFWQEETFDPTTIDSELALAEDLGFNTLRIYLHEKLWYADKVGFKSRINRFMDIAESHGMKLIITFFSNGGNHNREFSLGRQPEAIPGVHNSNWVPSPGADVINDPSRWPEINEYMQDILRTYKDDPRVLYWCLCNEPENIRYGCDVKDFMPAVYSWAREIKLSQPVSSPIWIRPGYKGATTKLDMVTFVCEHSDIITFHCYYPAEEMKTFITMLSRFGRPMICQEYMGRQLGSTFQTILPILKENRVGAINWGLVNGKCHFHLPWSHKDGDPEPELWFHDIFHPDHTPFSEEEVEFIKSVTPDRSADFTKEYETLVPNSELVTKGQAIYPRVKKLSRGGYIMFYQDGRLGPDCLYVTSPDLKKWSEPRMLFESRPVEGEDTRCYATTDAVVLGNGDILAVASFRASKGYKKGQGCGLVARLSKDGGKTWSEEQQIFDGPNWEPYILALPDGTLQCFFTDCCPATRNSGTSVLVSRDGGKTWGEHKRVCRQYKYTLEDSTKVYTDQMPCFRVLSDGETLLGFLEARLEPAGPQDKSKFMLSLVRQHGFEWTSLGEESAGPEDRDTNVCDGCAGYVSVFPDGRVLLSSNINQQFSLRLIGADGRFDGDWSTGWYSPFCGKGYWGSTEVTGQDTFVGAMHSDRGIQIGLFRLR